MRSGAWVRSCRRLVTLEIIKRQGTPRYAPGCRRTATADLEGECARCLEPIDDDILVLLFDLQSQLRAVRKASAELRRLSGDSVRGHKVAAIDSVLADLQRLGQ